MKEFVPPGLQEFVRNLSETSDKGIVSYIPFKFAFKNLTFLALRQNLPTAFFPAHTLFAARRFGAKIRQPWRKNSPFCPKRNLDKNLPEAFFRRSCSLTSGCSETFRNK